MAHSHAQYQTRLLISQGRDPRLYGVWRSLRNRCVNPNNKDWHKYGGRGIRVCKRWDDFDLFAKDVGQYPGKGWTLDRKRNNENYCRGNCRWATAKMQARNRRSTVLTYALVRQIRALRGFSQRFIARQFQISQSHVSRIIKRERWV